MPAGATARERIANKTTGELTSQPPRKTAIHPDVESTLPNTPYENRHNLPKVSRPTTPLRRASSAGPPSHHKSTHRTPGAQTTTPNALSKVGGSLRKRVVVTPHGRAAQREVEARRAGLTPGKDRRRSGRQQRETPRDTLRALSRLLAPKSQPIVPTPTGSKSQEGKVVLSNDDLDDELDLERPRLSLPLGIEDDEDDSLLLPPHSAGLENEDVTMQSIELGRRAISEQPPSRLSRGSFGSVRQSDRFGNLSGLDLDGYADNSIFLGQTGGDDEDILDASGLHGDNTETLRELGFDHVAMSLAMGQGNVTMQETFSADETENTFLFTVPPRDITQELSIEEESMTRSVLPEIMNLDPDRDVEGLDTNETTELNLFVGPPSGAEMETSVHDIAGQAPTLTAKKVQKASQKTSKVSKHGIQYPSLPIGVVKRMATRFAGINGNRTAKLNKDTIEAIMQASDWFFEQVSDDLGVYSQHAGRRTIDESDIVTLMARQRQTNATTTPFSLAQKHLPRELLQELRMVPPPKLKIGRQLQVVEEEV